MKKCRKIEDDILKEIYDDEKDKKIYYKDKKI